MAVRVKFYNLLAERSLSGREEYEVDFAPGLLPSDLIHREGFRGEEEEAIVVLVNDEQATRETPLKDGDRVELMINMVGGAGPILDQVNLVVKDMGAAVKFYRLLGVEIADSEPEWQAHHRSAVMTGGLDSTSTARRSPRSGTPARSLVVRAVASCSACDCPRERPSTSSTSE